MTVKKVAIIAAAGAVLLAGALTLSMTLITRNKIEVTATETSAQNATEQEEGRFILRIQKSFCCPCAIPWKRWAER